ncbi:superinfection immunity protein [Acidithiobacillus sp.]|uniref:superinfection immunity protein n=1 Tax=Acidithiobacillus sp. TaxID=1872118 RepID=UPI0032AE9CA9
MDHLFFGSMMMIAVIAAITVGVAIYFIPSVIAYSRSARNFLAIFLLNLFLGWSLLGWLGSLIWALLDEKRGSQQGSVVPSAPVAAPLPSPPTTATTVVAYCSRCGQTVAPDDRYCAHCGHGLP